MRSTVISELLEVHGADPRPEGPGRRLLILDPEQVGAVLHSNRFRRTDFIRQLAGSGLLATDGDLWRTRRKIMQASFPVRDSEAHLDSMRFAMPGFVKRLTNIAEEGRPVCLVDELMRVVGRVIYRAVFGIELGSEESRIAMFQPMMAAVGDVHWSLIAPGGMIDPNAIARLQSARPLADEEIAWMVERRRAVDIGIDDALGRLVEGLDEGLLQRADVFDEVRSLVLAATETSFNSLVWSFLLLDDHPEERAIIEEASSTAGRDEAIDRVVWETLRLYPPVWTTERQATEAVEEAGRSWEEGDRAVISIYRLHRDDRHWDDPDLFRPDRFAGLSDRSWRPPHRFAYMPFGAGPHLCIGRNLALVEMRWIIREVCRRFRLEFEAPDAVKPILGIAMRPTSPAMVRIHPRTESGDP